MGRAVDLDLRDHRLDVVRLNDHRVPLELHREALEGAAGPGAALADLVVGDVQERIRGRIRVGTQDQPGQVAPDKRPRLRVVGRDALQRLGLVDPRETEQGGKQVGVARRRVDLALASPISGLETRKGTCVVSS